MRKVGSAHPVWGRAFPIEQEAAMDGMGESYPRQPLHLLDSPRTVLHDRPLGGEADFAGPHGSDDFAARLFAWESLSTSADSVETGELSEPYSLPWFLSIEAQRHGRQGRWIPKLLEFEKHSGEKLLGLGNGLGTDWIQYARQGASVLVCSPSSEYLALCRRNFELRCLTGQFLHAPPEALPLATASIDVACVSGLLHQVSDPRPVVDEIYRVLKPGGKALVVVPASYDVDWWYHTCFPWQFWLTRRNAGRSVGHFSARRLRRFFNQFIDHRVHKRHLSRADVPRIWRWAPRSVLERLMGRVLILRTFKPLSSAIPVSMAA